MKVPLCPFCGKPEVVDCYLDYTVYFNCSNEECMAVADFLGFEPEPVKISQRLLHEIIKSQLRCFNCKRPLDPKHTRVYSATEDEPIAVSFACNCHDRGLKDYTISNVKVASLINKYLKAKQKRE